jgi:hypothetical protein
MWTINDYNSGAEKVGTFFKNGKEYKIYQICHTRNVYRVFFTLNAVFKYLELRC